MFHSSEKNIESTFHLRDQSSFLIQIQTSKLLSTYNWNLSQMKISKKIEYWTFKKWNQRGSR